MENLRGAIASSWPEMGHFLRCRGYRGDRILRGSGRSSDGSPRSSACTCRRTCCSEIETQWTFFQREQIPEAQVEDSSATGYRRPRPAGVARCPASTPPLHRSTLRRLCDGDYYDLPRLVYGAQGKRAWDCECVAGTSTW